LTFQPSTTGTIGVELELQVLDRDTGNLAPGAQRILDACAEEGIEGVTGEFLLSMLEVKTGVCRDVAEVAATLPPLLSRVGNITRSLGYDLAVAGTHPFARPSASAVSPGERYQNLRRRQGWLAYQENIFGLHVHVGVPGAEESLGLIGLLTPYLPHLLALSANSPFWQGVDTGFASVRGVLFRPAAHAGVPPHFARWEDFAHYCEVMHAAGLIGSTKDLYWDVRPRPAFGTIELRVFDAPASLATLLGLAALARCLVLDGVERLRRDPQLLGGKRENHFLAAENKWLAARFGLSAECVYRDGGPRLSLASGVDELLDELQPVASKSGEAGFLEVLRPGRFESGAERQRHVYRQSGSWQAVVDDLKNRWLAEVQPSPAVHVNGPDPATSPEIPAPLPSGTRFSE
jgi:carboxylate-amine ligase